MACRQRQQISSHAVPSADFYQCQLKCWWFAGNLNDEEVAEMVQNMQLAASEMDSVLVQLLSTWAERGRDASPRSQVCHNLQALTSGNKSCLM